MPKQTFLVTIDHDDDDAVTADHVFDILSNHFDVDVTDAPTRTLTINVPLREAHPDAR